MTCSQCELLSINGVVCHETGCPNSRATWDADRQEWVKFIDCFDCGYPVELGTACGCGEDMESPNDLDCAVSTPLGEAIRVLGIYTAGSYNICDLSGPRHASQRAHVLSTLQARTVPQSKAGVNAIRDAFWSACQITGECPAHRESNFAEFCRTYES